MLKFTAKLVVFVCFIQFPSAKAATAINSVRVWPASEYTRLTIESNKPIQFSQLSLSNPERLVIDLKEVEIKGPLGELANKIREDDPYIKSIRVALFKPGTVRLVFHLKSQVKPQLFNLMPVAKQYGHRLVLDIYPAIPFDPMMALLQKSEETGQAKPTSTEIPPREVSTEKRGTANIQAAPQTLAKPGSPPQRGPDMRSRTIIIAIDAGHGGEDPGARGYNGTHEKNITLTIARKLKDLIDSATDMRGVLIRDGDYFVSLNGRVQKARQAHADLLISIHADAFIKPHARGSSVFILSEHGATSASARWLAKKENEADLIGGVNLAEKESSLAFTLFNLQQDRSMQDSEKLANFMLSQISQINVLHSRSVQRAGFAVLKSRDIPSILIETAFISNPNEELRLNNVTHQEEIAHAIFSGIQGYFATNPPLSRPMLVQN